MKFQPWVDFKEDCSPLPIPEPPCKGCVYWRPHRNYVQGPGPMSGRFDGVVLCTKEEMEHDFSCFEPKATCAAPDSKKEGT